MTMALAKDMYWAVHGLEMDHVDGSHHFQMEPVVTSLVGSITEFISA